MFSRVDRINELIKETLASIIAEEIDISPGIFITVTKVDTSRDLRYARVFVSVFPENKFGEAMRVLKRNIYSIQGKLNRKLSMKPLPRIDFISDKTEAEADKMEKLLKEID
ncbi:MAG: 30S ribosome-binding factor RbfA [Parcubacteria group bacterium]|jgi:ribosome-binding factor A